MVKSEYTEACYYAEALVYARTAGKHGGYCSVGMGKSLNENTTNYVDR